MNENSKATLYISQARFLTPRPDQEQFAEHIAAADVFMFPSRTDTFGLVLLGALASGVPVQSESKDSAANGLA